MSDSDLVIWWLSPDDLKAIELHGVPTWLPPWVEREVKSAQGRNGRGRLWVAKDLGPVPNARFDDEVGTAMQTRCAQCAGIVITADLVPRLLHLPGVVTDFELERWLG